VCIGGKENKHYIDYSGHHKARRTALPKNTRTPVLVIMFLPCTYDGFVNYAVMSTTTHYMRLYGRNTVVFGVLQQPVC